MPWPKKSRNLGNSIRKFPNRKIPNAARPPKANRASTITETYKATGIRV
ncbi:Uncharacterised protein [Vibrio cholerae]|uniref:Uncharacterized protein n=1 Tax=Vibrio cholerae TaxID=666 RepID=A0A656AGV8_VIBCL|nr:Uncharacterised protein [Vibrio cholerae]CSD13664.1 Uncharacterised protein [Vibrio cholerae]